MKKVYIFIVLGFMLGVSVHAKSQEPQYKIIANSNQESDIKEMYEVKGKLLEDFKTWVKGVDNKDQVLADHQSDYQATYKQGVYKVYALIDSPNKQSENFHIKRGFKEIGCLPNTAYKLGKWCNLKYYEKELRECAGTPVELIAAKLTEEVK